MKYVIVSALFFVAGGAVEAMFGARVKAFLVALLDKFVSKVEG